MPAHMRQLTKWIIISLTFILIHLQCYPYYSAKQSEKVPSTLLNRMLLTRYDVSYEHIRSLQYYISNEIRLLKTEDKHSYEYKNHALGLRDDHYNKLIVFPNHLPGMFHDMEYKTTGCLFWKKKRMQLTIHFKPPDKHLDFLENDNGHFELIRDKNNRVLFENQYIPCETGGTALLEIDVYKSEYQFHNSIRHIEGAKYERQNDDLLWKVIVAAAGMLLVIKFLGNKE